MMMNYDEFTKVSDCAIASDGGSLCIELAGSNGSASFVLVQSISSRGTKAYGAVLQESGEPLAHDDVVALCARLACLQGNSTCCADLVREFVDAALLGIQRTDLPPAECRQVL